MKNEYKALLLSAGLGTRLRPLTNDIPKCLVEINNKPILHMWLDKLQNLEINSVLINTHYLANKVYESIQRWNSKNLKVYTIYEKELIGTAGTLINNLSFFKGSKGLILHADNVTDDDLKELIKAHKNRPSKALITMLTFETENPEQCGVIELDNNNLVKGFYEKISNPPTKLANGAIYAFDEDFIEYLSNFNLEHGDISLDIIPKINGRIFTYKTNSNFIDIGTHTNLKKARELWK
ncbi:nucleotidyltransferase family protein [Prochlorococcus marinus]|uniref:Putative sugar-phosphate nucleotidyl transferase n=1 Tax=Prochlorococcus marinus (strain AS9601) TaxID=146891 RepID=A2BSG2_PROMS|nr:nucleotidyltransferase family protein [Prochlorococcus marinus]ABM70723.1 Putative sugar-phosphate nucleotidyl transferase [Prochlorococcus marinus str. AS9601]